MPSFRLRSLFGLLLLSYMWHRLIKPYFFVPQNTGEIDKAAMKELHLLRASASDLQSLMQNGDLTSVQLVKACFTQVKKYDRTGPTLRAIISLPPEEKLLAIAENLDRERAAGKLRGPFHGIPVIVKDSINTDPSLGMPTTLGSYAFEKSRPKKSATVVDTLVARGLIIFGKASLTELGNFKGDNLTSGWSAFSGQTQSAYVEGGVKHKEMRLGHSAPGGSSSGSAVGVSAGYSPLSIGTEADGSLCTPASRAALFGMKPTVGSTPMDGVMVISTFFDTVGAMAKTVSDLAIMVEYVQQGPGSSIVPDGGYQSLFQKDWTGLRLGVVDPSKWFLPPSLVLPVKEAEDQMKSAILDVVSKIREHGGEVVYPVELPHPVQAGLWDAMGKVMDYEARGVVETYLATRDDPGMKSLEDIVEFNNKHADLELPEDYPNQNALLDAVNHNITDDEYEQAKASLVRDALNEGLLKIMKEHKLDAILGPSDGPLASIAAATGSPVATMPLGCLTLNGRPFGLSVTTRPKADGVIFRVLSAFEATLPVRALPPLLTDDEVQPANL